MTNQNKLNKRNSINIILEAILFFILIAGTLYLVSVVLPIFFPDKGNFLQLSQEFKIIGIGMFSFLKPVVKLILILFISNWILRKFEVKLTSSTTVIDWNIQAFVGVIITFVCNCCTINIKLNQKSNNTKKSIFRIHHNNIHPSKKSKT